MMIDFSIMPSLECNLECSFCMYDAGPDNKEVLDLEKATTFINTWDWDKINMVGFYGGEPSINLPLYQKFIDLLEPTPKFIITNGAWSTDTGLTMTFLSFVARNDMYLIISGTTEHKPHQHQGVLQAIKEFSPKGVRLKGGDVIHRMGRGRNYPGAIPRCSGFCGEDERPTRLAIMPNGNVVYQNCHGNYPVVQTIDEPFEGIEKRIEKAVKRCQRGMV